MTDLAHTHTCSGYQICWQVLDHSFGQVCRRLQLPRVLHGLKDLSFVPGCYSNSMNGTTWVQLGGVCREGNHITCFWLGMPLSTAGVAAPETCGGTLHNTNKVVCAGLNN